ncbi:MAG TPA: hypothetical protein VIL85_23615 [Thermomicrobiales bacterium]
MSDEREWVPVEVIWDGGRGAEMDRDRADWPFVDRDEFVDFLSGALSDVQEELYLTKRKRKKFRGEGR